MAALGKTGGNKLKAKMAKENPDYYKDMAKNAWAKRKGVQAVNNSATPNE